MIENKKDLKEYIACDMYMYYSQSRKERMINWITKDPIYYIAKYLRFLRKEEYYYNTGKNKIHTLMYLYYFRKKNIIGNKIGFKIPRNCFGKGLTIYHHGQIIVNEKVKVGSFCILHGNNCIGNNGKVDLVPKIGDNLDLGFGAQIIGNVSLGNNVTVGTNAVVVKSENRDNIIFVGLPAKVK